jgi:hypothetical protein
MDCGLLGDEAFDEAFGRRGDEQCLARVDGSDRVGQCRWSDVFEEKSAGAGGQRREAVLVEVEGGEDDDLCCVGAVRTSRVAAMPSRRRIRMSIKTMSGCSGRVRRTVSAPSAALPTTSRSGSRWRTSRTRSGPRLGGRRSGSGSPGGLSGQLPLLGRWDEGVDPEAGRGPGSLRRDGRRPASRSRMPIRPRPEPSQGMPVAGASPPCPVREVRPCRRGGGSGCAPSRPGGGAWCW